jgi:hypothetical protein
MEPTRPRVSWRPRESPPWRSTSCGRRAIALHTSPQIAERRGPITRLTRLGVRGDFGLETVAPAQRQAIEDAYPRLNVEKHLGDAVLEQALRTPDKAPRNSWPASLVRAHLDNPHNSGVNQAF